MDERYSQYNPNNPYFNPDWKPTYNNNGPFQGYSRMGVPPVQFNTGQGNAPTAQPSTGGVNAAGIVSGATGLIGGSIGAYRMADEAKAIQTKAPSAQYDAFGNPVYNLNQFAINTNRIRPRGANAGEVISNTASNAGSGFALGNAIVPGIGGFIGAGVGAVKGFVESIFGGRRRKKKMAEARNKANRRLLKRQGKYNTEALAASQNRASMQSYYDQLNNTNRLVNLYGNE